MMGLVRRVNEMEAKLRKIEDLLVPDALGVWLADLPMAGNIGATVAVGSVKADAAGTSGDGVIAVSDHPLFQDVQGEALAAVVFDAGQEVKGRAWADFDFEAMADAARCLRVPGFPLLDVPVTT